MIYLLESAGVLAIFVLLYQFVLRRLTFFQANRWFLIVGIIASIIVPFVEIEQTVYVEQETASMREIPVEYLILMQQQLEKDLQTTREIVEPVDYTKMLLYLYIAITCAFLGKMAVELASLRRLIKSGKSLREHGFTLVTLSRKLTPFSFFNYICYSKQDENLSGMELIIEHEKVHARQWHTLDLLLSHLLRALFWINPLVWLVKRQISENLEFIADSHAKSNSNASISYERTLLSSAAGHLQPVLANNFFTPFIKKRILMLQKEASDKWHIYKYALILPVLVMFLYSFNVVERLEYIDADTSKSTQQESQVLNQKDDVKTQASVSNNKLAGLSVTGIPQPNSNKQTGVPAGSQTDSKSKDDLTVLKFTKRTTQKNLDRNIKNLERDGIDFQLQKSRFKNDLLVHLKFTITEGSYTSSHNYKTTDGINPVCISRMVSDGKPEWYVGSCDSDVFALVNDDNVMSSYFKFNDINAQKLIKDAAMASEEAVAKLEKTLKMLKKLNIDSAQIDLTLADLNYKMFNNPSSPITILSSSQFQKDADSLRSMLLGQLQLVNFDSLQNIMNSQAMMINMDSLQEVLNSKIINMDFDSIARAFRNKVGKMNFDSLTQTMQGTVDPTSFKMKYSQNWEPLNVPGIDTLRVWPQHSFTIDTVMFKDFDYKFNADSIYAYQPRYGATARTTYGAFSGDRPLIIVNGKKLNELQFAQLDQRKIKSMHVLKDQKALAFYGESGDNGVIVIDTEQDLDLLLKNLTPSPNPSVNHPSQHGSMIYYHDKMVNPAISSIDELNSITRDKLEIYGKEVQNMGYSFDIKRFKTKNGRLKKLKINFAGTDYSFDTSGYVSSMKFTYYKDNRKPELEIVTK
ncbi:MAG: M56 family metallopeptidase [Nonlabens sp.]